MGTQGDRLGLGQTHGVSHAAQRRDDLRRGGRCIGGARAIGQRRRRAARHAGLAEHAHQVAGPELEDFLARGRARGAHGLAGAGVDEHRPMQSAHADRRFARDEPGRGALRAPGIGQIAARGTDLDAGQVLRCAKRHLARIEPLRAQGVDDAKVQRRRGLDADETRIGGVVEIADPDHEHHAAEHPGAPGIMKAPGRAGLPSHRQARRRAGIGPRIVPEHVDRDEGRFFRQQPRAFGFEARVIHRIALLAIALRTVMQTVHHAAIGEHGVQAHEFFHRDLAATQRKREAVMRFAGHARHARAAQKFVQGRRFEFGRDRHGRHIAAAHQRFLRGDGADEAAIEIFGAERPERGRRVFQNRHRMQHALIDRERIDERFECRAGRTLGGRAIDLPVDARIVPIGRTDHRLDLHRRRIDEHRGRIADADIAFVFDGLADDAFERVLHAQIERGAHLAGVAGSDQGIAQMRRAKRQLGNAINLER